ncbi:MAG: hypothetical protein WAN46_06440 [Gammaproteobacteria bacterium]
MKRSRCQRSSVSGLTTCKASRPSAGQSGQDEYEQAVVVAEPRPLDAATQADELLTQQGVVRNQLRPHTGEVADGGDHPLRPGACRAQQAPVRPP